MIDYLIQTTADHPDLLKAVPPPGLLSAAEAARCAELRFERRRRDWLLGRWTAKHLVQAYLERVTGERRALVDLLIVNGADGVPEVEIRNGQCTMDNGLGTRPSLSISHSRDMSLCGVMDGAVGRVGVDLEWIEAREPGFVAGFFTPEEMALVAGCAPDLRDTLVTAIWSGKEAVLKALRVGLRTEPRLVTVAPRLDRAEKKPGLPPFAAGWQPLAVQVSQELVDPTVSSFSKFEGWWQNYEGFVLTIVGLTGGQK